MSYIDIILSVFIFVCVYIGFRKGLLISLLGAARLAAAVPISYYVGSSFYGVVYQNFVRAALIEKISDSLSDSEKASSLTDSINGLINEFPLLFDSDSKEKLALALDADAQAEYITDNILQPFAEQIIKIFLILLTFLLFYVITGIIISAAKKIRRRKNLPLHNTNSVFGAVFGFVKAAGIILIIFYAAQFAAEAAGKSEDFIKSIDESRILNFISQISA